jgi:hypothetical protein
VSTITAILEADADGTLHLPVPEMLRRGPLRVVATPLAEEEQSAAPLTAAEEASLLASLAALRARAGLRRRELPPEAQEQGRQAAFAALRQLRESNPYLELADPVAWQRELRQDRRLPLRD